MQAARHDFRDKATLDATFHLIRSQQIAEKSGPPEVLIFPSPRLKTLHAQALSETIHTYQSCVILSFFLSILSVALASLSYGLDASFTGTCITVLIISTLLLILSARRLHVLKKSTPDQP